MAGTESLQSKACRVAAGYARRYIGSATTFNESIVAVDSFEIDGDQSPAIRITYQCGFGVGTVWVVDEQVVRGDWRPLARCRRVALAVAALGAICAMAAVGDYVGRHRWFSEYGAPGWIWFFAAAAALTGSIAALGWSLADVTRWRARAHWFLVASVVNGTVAGAVALLARPSAASAAANLETGRRATAGMEADAVLQSKAGDPEERATARHVLDTLHLERVRAAESLVHVNDAFGGMWFSRAARDKAVAVMESRFVAAIADALAENDLPALHALAPYSAVLPGRYSHRLEEAERLVELRACTARQQLDCLPDAVAAARQAGVASQDVNALLDSANIALEADYRGAIGTIEDVVSPHAVRDRLETALVLAQIYFEANGSELGLGRTELAVRRDAAARAADEEDRRIAEQEREARRREAERQAREKAKKARAAEREARRKAAAEARERKRQRRIDRARHRRPARLRCCDGTLSPTCMCAGSHRGCCSHHDGVCGCAN